MPGMLGMLGMPGMLVMLGMPGMPGMPGMRRIYDQLAQAPRNSTALRSVQYISRSKKPT